MNIYRTLRAIFYLMLKQLTEKDFPDKRWDEIQDTVEEALGIVAERESNFTNLQRNHESLEGTCTAQGREINRLRVLLEDSRCDYNILKDQVDGKTRGKCVAMHFALTAAGKMSANKIPAIKEARSLIVDLGLAGAKHMVEAAYQQDFVPAMCYEGYYRKNKDKLEYWQRIPKKKKKK